MMFPVINQYAHREFRWGESDCCCFVRDCVKHATGRDIYETIQYQGKDGAKALIESRGSLYQLACDVFGEPINEPSDGDVGIADSPLGEILGIVFQGRFVVRTIKDVTDWPLSRCKAFWSAGCA